MIQKLNLALEDPTYFVYRYVGLGIGPDAAMAVSACHNFKNNAETNCGISDPAAVTAPDGPVQHTFIATCTVENQVIGCTPGFVMNEFQ